MGELFKSLRCLALRVFLVHPVEHRKVNCLGINQLDVFVPPTQPVDHKLGEPEPIRTER